MTLPPGQRLRDDFPRFGLDPFANRIAEVPPNPSIVFRPLGESEIVVSLDRFDAIDRTDTTSDFHCVTTWSVSGLRWSGWPLRAILEVFMPEALGHKPDETFIVFRALDGYASRLLLEDALDPSVLVADRLDGQPLCLNHGAPIRLVAPLHYGYKNLKHIKAIEFCAPGDERLGFGRKAFLEHPRARVALEERGGFPGRLLRYLYRPFIRGTERKFRKAMDEHKRNA